MIITEIEMTVFCYYLSVLGPLTILITFGFRKLVFMCLIELHFPNFESTTYRLIGTQGPNITSSKKTGASAGTVRKRRSDLGIF